MDEIINLKQTEKYSFELQARPTTGYLWGVESFDDKIVSVTFETAPIDEDISNIREGAYSVLIVTIEALSVGETDVMLSEKRPWEKDKAPINIKRLSVSVSE